MPKPDSIRIANAGGYWGDDPGQFRRQVELGPVDYVTLDFLAEITMSIMQKQRARDPDAGFARDFITQIEATLDLLLKRGVRVVTNAGGVNPAGCRRAVIAAAAKKGRAIHVAAVAGDDLLPHLDELVAAGASLDNMEDYRDFAKVRAQVSAANAYFGAWPVVEALRSGAQIVVTGRCTDTGITLAPMIHAFGWAPDDWDRLAAGIVAGHIVECGAQSSGGNYTDWREIPRFADIGYPIVEMYADGSFFITKHAGTGGAVTVRTVKEQLLYEMGDPRAYLTPDVVADFASMRLEQAGPDRVRVWNVKGRPAPPSLKISAAYADGWKANGALILSGPEAVAKANAFAELFWARLGLEFEATLTELVGASACWGPLAPASDPPELLLRLGVRDRDRAKVEAFSKLVPGVILSGPPGVAVTGGRPQVQEVVAYWPALVPRELVRPTLITAAGERTLDWPTPLRPMGEPAKLEPETWPPSAPGDELEVPLSDLAHGRSGDKGDTANIGVIARAPEVYPWLVAHLTADRVKEYFDGLCEGLVERHLVPNLGALNFLLGESLGGGGTVSLRLDAQGKTLSHALLAMTVRAPRALVAAARRDDNAHRAALGLDPRPARPEPPAKAPVPAGVGDALPARDREDLPTHADEGSGAHEPEAMAADFTYPPAGELTQPAAHEDEAALDLAQVAPLAAEAIASDLDLATPGTAEESYEVEPTEPSPPAVATAPEAATPEPLAEPEVVAVPEPIAEPEVAAAPEPIAEPEVAAAPEPIAEPEVVAVAEPIAQPERATVALTMPAVRSKSAPTRSAPTAKPRRAKPSQPARPTTGSRAKPVARPTAASRSTSAVRATPVSRSTPARPKPTSSTSRGARPAKPAADARAASAPSRVLQRPRKAGAGTTAKPRKSGPSARQSGRKG